ncbi:MAG: Holliday junction branch migration protein RuvA [Bacteroidales bacterium]|nr:Holliday junction branch migration protein RuvA [Bacteroidales bacterium]
MIEYIEGKVTALYPTHMIIETAGTGYLVNISLFTFTRFEGVENGRILIHQIIREDAHQLYGFATEGERELFRLLISVSGVGANTARMMLSSIEPSGIEKAILTGDVVLLKGIKGIGLKTAERIIVDLRDKVGKSHLKEGEIFSTADNSVRDEAFTALVMLGFPKNAVGKVLERLIKEEGSLSVEQMIRKALQIL